MESFSKKSAEEEGGNENGAGGAPAVTNFLLQPIRHEWVIENYPRVIECLKNKHFASERRHTNCPDCDFSRCANHRGTFEGGFWMPNSRGFLGPQHRSIIDNQGQLGCGFGSGAGFGFPDVPSSSPASFEFPDITHNMGPIQIGRTKWRLKLRMRSFELWLVRDVVEDDGGNAVDGDAAPPPRLFPDDERLAFRVSLGGHVRCAGGKCIDHMNEPSPLPDFPEEATFNVANNNRVLLGQLPNEYSKLRILFEAFVRPEDMIGAPCDFRVVVLDKNGEGGKVLTEFAVHRSVLRAGSPVFRAMLGEDSECEEAKTGVLKIGDLAPATVKHLLAFIYTGHILSDFGRQKDLSDLEVLDAAEQYKVDDEVIKLECGRRLLALINPGNAIKMLAKAELYGLDELKQGAMRYIRDNRPAIDDDLQNNKEAMGEIFNFKLFVDLINVISPI